MKPLNLVLKLCQSFVDVVLTLTGDDVSRDGVDGAGHHGHGHRHRVEIVGAVRRRRKTLDRDWRKGNWRHRLGKITQ